MTVMFDLRSSEVSACAEVKCFALQNVKCIPIGMREICRFATLRSKNNFMSFSTVIVNSQSSIIESEAFLCRTRRKSALCNH